MLHYFTCHYCGAVECPMDAEYSRSVGEPVCTTCAAVDVEVYDDCVAADDAPYR